jgi:hypothetical protein
MHRRTADARSRFLDRVAEAAAAAAGDDTGLDVAAYVRQYYRNTAGRPEGPRGRGSCRGGPVATSSWRCSAKAGMPRIRVCNPAPRDDGWNSPHTIVQVVTDDMPFLVDSTSMVLNRHGSYIHLTVHPVLHVRRDDHGRLLEVPSPEQAGTRRPPRVLHAPRDRPRDGAGRLQRHRRGARPGAGRRARCLPGLGRDARPRARDLRGAGGEPAAAGPGDRQGKPRAAGMDGGRPFHLPGLPRVRARPGRGRRPAARHPGHGARHPARPPPKSAATARRWPAARSAARRAPATC